MKLIIIFLGYRTAAPEEMEEPQRLLPEIHVKPVQIQATLHLLKAVAIPAQRQASAAAAIFHPKEKEPG